MHGFDIVRERVVIKGPSSQPSIRLSVLAALITFAVQAFAQDSSAAKRPTVGLTLEGGGALGLAHIGVIKWMEEHRIPVDYVGGTSMGGLVGGFYAVGMNPAELEKVVSTIDWNAVLGTQIAYRDLVYRRKQDRRAFQNSLEFGLRGGSLNPPAGLNSGQEITFLLDRNTLPYSSLASFDELPIPFRCVAADLTTGKPHVFDSGPWAKPCEPPCRCRPSLLRSRRAIPCTRMAGC
jgi:NTE family protein